MVQLQSTLLCSLVVLATVGHALALAPLSDQALGGFSSNLRVPSPNSLAMGGVFRQASRLPWAKQLGSSFVRGALMRSSGAKATSALAGNTIRKGAEHLALRAKSFGGDFKAIGSRTVTLARSFPEAWTRLMQTRPVTVCGTLEGIRYLVGDVIAQRIEQRKGPTPDKVNLERLAVLTFWGVFYGAGLGYWSYHTFYPSLFGTTGMRAALKTTALDLLVTCPFVYFPMWHVFKEATDRWVERKGTKGAVQPMNTMESLSDYSRAVWHNYITTFVSDAGSMAAVWAPLHIINFRFIPLDQRFPFIAVTGIIWTTTFSYLQYGLV